MEHAAGKAARLRKWQHRLANAKHGSMQWLAARDMIAELTRPEVPEKTQFAADIDPRQLRTQLMGKAKTYNYAVQAQAAAKANEGYLFCGPVGEPAVNWDGWVQLGYTTDEGMCFEYGDSSESFGSPSTAIVRSELREETEPMNEFSALAQTTPERLEQAAANMAAQAQMLREFDEREPQGFEPTISFTHKYLPTDEKEYTFVAFKCNGEGGSNKWYTTGQYNREGMTWREMGAKFPNVAHGRFHVATGWEYQADES